LAAGTWTDDKAGEKLVGVGADLGAGGEAGETSLLGAEGRAEGSENEAGENEADQIEGEADHGRRG
jgi:hypothetical protein